MNIKESLNNLMVLCGDCQCMTEFEYEFVEKMEKRREAGGSFTVKELALIDKIHHERME